MITTVGRPSIKRRDFATRVHAGAHVIAALHQLSIELRDCRGLQDVLDRINTMLSAQCRSIGLDPATISEAVDEALDERRLEDWIDVFRQSFDTHQGARHGN